MSLASARAKLGTAHRQLLADWARTNDSWNDSASQAFFRNNVSQLEQSVRSAITAIEHMGEVLERARRECANPPDAP